MTFTRIGQIRSDLEIYQELAGTKCHCGNRKGERKTFCWKCWCKLSASLKRRLYDPAEYPETVRESYRFLDARRPL